MWRNLLIVLAVSLAVVLTLVVFFRVDCDKLSGEINEAWYDEHVSGNVHYSAERIWEASGIEDGDNLLILSRERIAARVMTALPYVQNVTIKKILPNQVILVVSEFDVSYTILDETGQYWLITAGGKLLEPIDAKQAQEHLCITGFTITDPEAGQIARVSDGISETVLTAATDLLQQLEQTELSEKILSIDVPNSYQISMNYQDQYKVLIGDTTDLDYKIRLLVQVLDGLDSYTTGEIDLTDAAEKKAIVRTD